MATWQLKRGVSWILCTVKPDHTNPCTHVYSYCPPDGYTGKCQDICRTEVYILILSSRIVVLKCLKRKGKVHCLAPLITEFSSKLIFNQTKRPIYIKCMPELVIQIKNSIWNTIVVALSVWETQICKSKPRLHHTTINHYHWFTDTTVYPTPQPQLRWINIIWDTEPVGWSLDNLPSDSYETLSLWAGHFTTFLVTHKRHWTCGLVTLQPSLVTHMKHGACDLVMWQPS